MEIGLGGGFEERCTRGIRPRRRQSGPVTSAAFFEFQLSPSRICAPSRGLFNPLLAVEGALGMPFHEGKRCISGFETSSLQTRSNPNATVGKPRGYRPFG
jgi:hypothetical protein